MARRFAVGVTALALGAVGLLAAPVARADVVPPEPDPATVTADALPTWQINGVVYSQAVVGNTVYVTGSFTRARPPGVAAGGAGEVVANNIFAYDLTTGNRVASFNHSLNAQGLVIRKAPDGSRIYVGGDFSSVDGVARGKVAAFDTATGALVTSWAPNVGGQVRGLGVTGSTVYVGGNFTSANGQARTRFASFQTSNGAMTTWAPSATGGYVWTMTMSPDNTRVIAGGSFTQINGTDAYGMGAIDAGNAAALPWPAQNKIRTAGNDGAITTLKTDGNLVYGGGYAFGPGASFEGTFGLDPNTGQIVWVNDCLGDTYDVAPQDKVLYVVSHYHDCSVVGGFPDTNPRARWQKATAQYSVPTNTTVKNDAYGWNFIGYQYAKMLNWWPDLAFGSYTPSRQAAWAVDTSGDYVVMGGEFPRVNGANQQGLTRMRKHAGAPNLRGPRYTTIPATPTPSTNAVSLQAGSVRVSWGSAWDQDNESLTYEVLRDNNTWVYSTEGKSTFWTLPKMGFIDTGLAPGSTHRYQVRIKDADGNILWSPVSNTVTVGTGAASPYAAAVTADGAEHFWRLGEPSGSTGIDYAGFDDVTFNGTYTRGTSGAITGDADGSSSFDGTSGYAVNSAPVVGPDVFSQEAWFRTTSTTGGKIVSFGDQPTGTSNNYDRHIYMDPQGRIWFGVYNNAMYTVNTSNALNDGQWHHVVGTLDASGVTLYVDGRKIGKNSGTNAAQPYTGYWRIGGDSAWNGNPYFNGDIDDVAIYPNALTLPQVQNHYVAGGRTLNVPTRPTDAYGRAVWDSGPDIYWRLGETAGTVAKDSSPNESDGTYTGGYTRGVTGAVTGTGNTATSFNGVDGGVYSNQQYDNPRTYSLETWVKTTTTNGGKLIGFGCAQVGGSGCYDRHVYMNNDGKVTFGVWTGFTNTITTPTALNDGQWHYVVASQNTTEGMKLYVDGVLVGTNGQTDAQGYAGYWRLGGDSHWGCCSAYLDGTLDEAAVYSSVLSPAEVAAHYQAAGGQLPNQLPTASFTHGETGLTTSVDGSASSDPDGTVSTYSWSWGDGTPAGSGATATHAYATGGTYTVTLTVTDNRGGTATTSQQVTVTAPPPNQAPTATFTSSASFLKASVDGSGSSDPDGTVDAYAWAWGDGTPAGSGATATHTYAAAGTYPVTLTVTDDKGATATVTRDVTVVANQAPTAAFSHTETLLTTSVNGSASSDPDGTVNAYAWGWGDGTPAGSGATATHTYAAAGTYTVTLTVTDDQGATSTSTAQVTVAGPPNQAPTASFTSSTNGLAVSVNGSASSDPDGTVNAYAWGWGDGTPAGSGATATHTYAAAGTYTVTLTVTDDKGATGTRTSTVTVAAPTVFATDDFGRTVANGWGTADTGGAWTLGGPAARWSVSGGVGRVSLNAGDGYTGYLGGVSARDVEVAGIVSTDKAPTGGGLYTSLVVRRVAANTDYRAKVRLNANGTVTVYLTRMVSNAETVLSSTTVPGLTYAAGDRLAVRLQATGSSPTTVRAKVWKSGATEPTAWTLTSTDSTAVLQAPGSVGLYAYSSSTVTNSPVVYSLDQLWSGAPRP